MRGPNNNYLVGNFGKLKFTDLEDAGEPKIYTAFRIEMHFASEHLIKGSSSDIEVVVYHSLRDQGFSPEKFAELYGDDATLDKEYQYMLASTDLILSFMVQKKALFSED